MFTHVMVGTDDLEASRRFYDAVLGVLGIGEPLRDGDRYFYRGGGVTFAITKPIDGGPASGANGGTIGFKAESPEQVHAFHEAGLEAGGSSCEDPPGLRPRGAGGYYLAYLLDPAGNKICALHWVK
jgi:catechol 2,3-dioxygenase-like lactoylglutathione lyase family enzyme